MKNKRLTATSIFYSRTGGSDAIGWDMLPDEFGDGSPEDKKLRSMLVSSGLTTHDVEEVFAYLGDAQEAEFMSEQYQDEDDQAFEEYMSDRDEALKRADAIMKKAKGPAQSSGPSRQKKQKPVSVAVPSSAHEFGKMVLAYMGEPDWRRSDAMEKALEKAKKKLSLGDAAEDAFSAAAGLSAPNSRKTILDDWKILTSSLKKLGVGDKLAGELKAARTKHGSRWAAYYSDSY